MKVSIVRVCASFLMLMVVAAHTLPTTTTTTERVESVKKQKLRRFWWSNPCGHQGDHFPHVSRNASRKKDHKTVNETAVVIELEIAHSHIKDIFNKTTVAFPNTELNYPWLPKADELLKQVTKRKITPAFAKFYKGLMKFAITIECLMRGEECDNFRKRHGLPYRTVAENDARNRVLAELKGKLRKLLCEVNDFLWTRVKKLPPAPINFYSIDFKWLEEVDGSGTTNIKHDYVVFKTYFEYLSKWVHLTKKLAKRVLRQHAGHKKNKSSRVQKSKTVKV
ncbi:uncharacterized protein LOC135941079 [Cloeon dipterum]|uniref:uncharacterized protein LOC135941079 n=1 Tax=Cloeon dipterum TaxID=197152 RepID=UPI00321F7F6A